MKNLFYIFITVIIFTFSIFPSFSQESMLIVNTGHKVQCWDFTTDESKIITAGDDKTIKMWDVKQKKLLYTFPAFSNTITAITISPKGKYIIAGSTASSKSDTSEIRIIDLSSRKTLMSINNHPIKKSLGAFYAHPTILSLKASYDEKYLTCFYGWGYVRVFEIATGKELLAVDLPQYVFAENIQLDYSTDSKRLLVLVPVKKRMRNFSYEDVPGEIEFLGVYNLETKKNIFSGSKKAFENLSCASFSENPNVLLIGKKSGLIYAYDYTSNKTLWEYSENLKIPGNILLSSDNKYLALSVGSDRDKMTELKIVDYKNRKLISDINSLRPKETLLKPQFSIDCSSIYGIGFTQSTYDDATKSYLSPQWIIRKYDLSVGKEVLSIPVFSTRNTQLINNLFLTPDSGVMGGSYMPVFSLGNSPFTNKVGSDSLNLWSLKNGVKISNSYFGKDALGGISDGLKYELLLLDDDNENRFYSSDKKLLMKIQQVDDFNNYEYSIYEYYPAQKKTGNKLESVVLKNFHFLNFSPDNTYAIFSESHGITDQVKINDDLVIFTTKGFKKVADIAGAMDAGSNCLRFSSNGKFLAYNARRSQYDEYHNLYIIDLEKKVLKWKFEDFGGIKKFGTFSPDGKYFVSASMSSDARHTLENKFNLIDLSTGKFTTHAMPIDIVYVLFDNSSTKLYILGLDGRIVVWDILQQKEIITMVRMNNNKDFVVITPDGRFDGTKEGILNCLHYASGNTIIPLESFYDKYYSPNLWAINLGNEKISEVVMDIKTIALPPIVKISSPISNSVISSDQLNVTVEVTDQGGGIDEILLYHNGKLVQTTNRGFKPIEQKDAQTIKTFTITLLDGENKIKATAFNAQRTEAIPDEILVNYTGVKASKPNLYMLVIGINEYKNTKYNLNYAVADATAFKDAILGGSSAIFGDVNILFIKNTEATKTKIFEALNKIKSQAQQKDMFVFYYAGHGAMSEEQKALFYLIPTDVTQMFSSPLLQEKAISATELKEFSTEIKAQKQVFVLDACQSGGVEEVLAARGAAEEKAIAQLARSTGTYWLAAANSQQFAGEFKDLGHGLFTYCILQGFTGKADAQNDKKVTVQELSAYLNDQVPIISKQYKGSEQYPVTYGFGQDFPIIIIK